MRIIFLFLVGLLFGLSACGERATPTPQPIVAAILQPLPPGDPAQGEKLFRRTLLGARPEPGCITCHSLALATVLLGPSLADIATRSATTIQQADYQGQAESVEQYLQESISAPNVYLAPGFAPDVMRPTFAAELSPQEIADLVAFLLTLKE
jgi:cytochrome c2